MPHAIIEYSSNLKDAFAQAGISALTHKTLGAAGVFAPENLKTRAYEAIDFHVGLQGQTSSFVHVTLYLMAGRDMEQKNTVGTVLLNALQNALPQADQITIDIRDMVKETYQKFVKV